MSAVFCTAELGFRRARWVGGSAPRSQSRVDAGREHSRHGEPSHSTAAQQMKSRLGLAGERMCVDSGARETVPRFFPVAVAGADHALPAAADERSCRGHRRPSRRSPSRLRESTTAFSLSAFCCVSAVPTAFFPLPFIRETTFHHLSPPSTVVPHCCDRRCPAALELTWPGWTLGYSSTGEARPRCRCTQPSSPSTSSRLMVTVAAASQPLRACCAVQRAELVSKILALDI